MHLQDVSTLLSDVLVTLWVPRLIVSLPYLGYCGNISTP